MTTKVLIKDLYGIYVKNLVNKVFIFKYENVKKTVEFKKEQFLHLTGLQKVYLCKYSKKISGTEFYKALEDGYDFESLLLTNQHNCKSLYYISTSIKKINNLYNILNAFMQFKTYFSFKGYETDESSFFSPKPCSSMNNVKMCMGIYKLHLYSLIGFSKYVNGDVLFPTTCLSYLDHSSTNKFFPIKEYIPFEIVDVTL